MLLIATITELEIPTRWWRYGRKIYIGIIGPYIPRGEIPSWSLQGWAMQILARNSVCGGNAELRQQCKYPRALGGGEALSLNCSIAACLSIGAF